MVLITVIEICDSLTFLLHVSWQVETRWVKRLKEKQQGLMEECVHFSFFLFLVYIILGLCICTDGCHTVLILSWRLDPWMKFAVFHPTAADFDFELCIICFYIHLFWTVCLCFPQDSRVQTVLQASYESSGLWLHTAAVKRKERKTDEENEKEESIYIHLQPSRGELRPAALRDSCCSTHKWHKVGGKTRNVVVYH